MSRMNIVGEAQGSRKQLVCILCAIFLFIHCRQCENNHWTMITLLLRAQHNMLLRLKVADQGTASPLMWNFLVCPRKPCAVDSFEVSFSLVSHRSPAVQAHWAPPCTPATSSWLRALPSVLRRSSRQKPRNDKSRRIWRWFLRQFCTRCFLPVCRAPLPWFSRSSRASRG